MVLKTFKMTLYKNIFAVLVLEFDDSCYVDVKHYHLASRFQLAIPRLISHFVNQSECEFLFNYAI